MNDIGMVVSIIVAFLIVVIFLSSFLERSFHIHRETPQKKAGRYGEKIATSVISEVLRDEDVLLTNVPIRVEGKQTELDNVIINTNGIFIIEVKNLHGVLSGDEESYDWIQTKSSSGGEFYQKTVKNPMKQVKRQIYILSSYLKRKNLGTWIDGYVFFVERNCPIKSDLVLETRKDIDLAIHSNGKQTLSKKKQSAIIKSLIK
ncbi:MAG: NERD domain-containing protein [Lachnospiraceae bacterium]|nr:NERD domain-containing protein [Lachnospiraceae bacterium]